MLYGFFFKVFSNTGERDYFFFEKFSQTWKGKLVIAFHSFTTLDIKRWWTDAGNKLHPIPPNKQDSLIQLNVWTAIPPALLLLLYWIFCWLIIYGQIWWNVCFVVKHSLPTNPRFCSYPYKLATKIVHISCKN